MNEVLKEIHKLDHKIIHLLQDRLKLSRKYYSLEAKSEKLHPNINKEVFHNLEKISDLASHEVKLVNKIYKNILKHESKERKKVHKIAIKKYRNMNE